MSDEDLLCLEERHLFRKASRRGSGGVADQIIGAGQRCRHGWPQAVLYEPLYRERPGKHFRFGDMTRLTCPLLVAAVDEMEKAGAMVFYNLRCETDAEWGTHLRQVNEAHKHLREQLVADRAADLADARLHYGEKTFATAMGAGLASMSMDSQDVKCLHAHVADELLRRGQNPIGQQALKDIEDQGIPTDGTDQCCDNCNVHLPLEEARWRLQKCKNTAGKRLSRQRQARPP